MHEFLISGCIAISLQLEVNTATGGAAPALLHRGAYGKVVLFPNVNEKALSPAGPPTKVPPIAPAVTSVDLVDAAQARLALCRSSSSPVIAAAIPCPADAT